MLLRSVGYRTVALPRLPFDQERSTVPNAEGRVLRDGVVSSGEYVAGWAGRGPVGVLGTNRADAAHVVAHLLSDVTCSVRSERADLVDTLRSRRVQVVGCDGWSAIDRAAKAMGEAEGRTRAKLPTWPSLMTVATREIT
jgi:ferredoxin--NADP+ reductase